MSKVWRQIVFSKTKMNFGGSATPLGASKANKAIRTKARLSSARLRVDCGDTFGLRQKHILEDIYPSPIQLYDNLPGISVSLADFETMAVERLRVLRVVEKHASYKAPKFSEEWATNINSELKGSHLDKENIDNGELSAYSISGLEKAVANRERDHLSHYILRLAYCKTEDLRRWFVAQESDLFRARAMQMTSREMSAFLDASNVQFVEVSREEMDEIKGSLSFHNYRNNQERKFYKVPFQDALELVKGRKVYLRRGMCYVPQEDMITLVAGLYKVTLSKALISTNKILPNLDEDDRLLQVIGDLDRRYTGKDYSVQDGDQQAVTPQMIPGLAEQNFPLCMRSMQCTLSSSHHLKYKARLQYGLFLKGIGLSLEDAIKFFRGEFTKAHVDPEKFDKEYTYGIRYNYGKEGKKVNWTPWNCMRIIMESVGPGENHGCPYRHKDEDTLRSLLVKSGLEGEKLNEVLQLAKDGHYQRACGAQFKYAHKGFEISTVITSHPNQYYSESIKGGIQPATSHKGLGGVKVEKAHMYTEIKSDQSEKKLKAEDHDDIAKLLEMDDDDMEDVPMDQS